MDRVAAVLRGQSGDDSAEQDGEEGAAFDQRIAGRQFGARKMVGQDAVFDRPEQRSDHAVQDDGDEQQHDRVDGETGNRNGGDEDLRKLQPLRHQGLVVAVGEFAAEPREKEERRDQRGTGKRDQDAGVGARRSGTE